MTVSAFINSRRGWQVRRIVAEDAKGAKGPTALARRSGRLEKSASCCCSLAGRTGSRDAAGVHAPPWPLPLEPAAFAVIANVIFLLDYDALYCSNTVENFSQTNFKAAVRDRRMGSAASRKTGGLRVGSWTAYAVGASPAPLPSRTFRYVMIECVHLFPSLSENDPARPSPLSSYGDLSNDDGFFIPNNFDFSSLIFVPMCSTMAAAVHLFQAETNAPNGVISTEDPAGQPDDGSGRGHIARHQADQSGLQQ